MSAYNDLILLSSPLIFYALDDKPATGARLALGSGVVEDFSGNASHGAEWGAASYNADGLVGDSQPCDNFTGGTRIDGPGNSSYANGINMTVEFWYNPNDISPSQNKALVNNGWGSGNELFHFRQNTGGFVDVVWKNSGNSNVTMASSVLSTSENYHFAYTVNSTSGRKLYVNGAQVDSSSDTYIKTVTNRNLIIAGYTGGGWSPNSAANGSIDKVAIYTTDLDATTIESHYNWLSGGGGGGSSASLLHLLRRRRRV